MNALAARELRDLIYIQLFDQDWSSDVHIGYQRDYSSCENISVEGHSPSPPDHMGKGWPYYLIREYVNEIFIRELSETFYRNTHFFVLHENHIHRLLTYGPLLPYIGQSYVRPPSHFIRHLKIHLYVRQTEIQCEAKKYGVVEGERRCYRYLVDTMRRGIQIKPMCALKLTLCISAGTKLCLEKYEESLALMVYDLRASGAKIEIECRQEEGWPEFKYDEPISVWKERIRTNSAFVSGNVPGTSEISSLTEKESH